MNIVGGIRGGQRLVSVKSVDIRPTSERVREALFSILGARLSIDGITMLDLYAGSGAVGFEALSRGAQQLVFVEQSKRCCRLIEDNAKRLGFESSIEIIYGMVERSLGRIADSYPHFDVVYIDPPYRIEPWPVLAEISSRSLCSGEGIVVAEHASRLSVPPSCETLCLQRSFVYGDSTLSLYCE